MEKLAIVTGATGGLGGEYAKDLAKRGYNLVISG
jgi:short-subunit dehydrogenase